MKFLNSIGESEIREQSIKVWGYPFEPAIVYPEKEIFYHQIEEIHVKQYPPTLKIGKELIFVSKSLENQLIAFTGRNQINLSERAANWELITEPFLDTTFTEEQTEATARMLERNGFSRGEITGLREEIGRQMYKYNFDTLLWEWGVLGLMDVLSAMKPKLKKEVFRNFYWRAMEIEQRNGN